MRAHRRADRALSLLELVVVLAILALGAAVIVPSVGRGASSLEERVFRDRVVAFVREAQREADRSGYPCAVRYLAREHALEAGGSRLLMEDSWEAAVREVDALGNETWRRLGPWFEGSEGGVVAVELMRWSPGSLPSPCDWRLRSDGGAVIRVRGDLLEGVRIE